MDKKKGNSTRLLVLGVALATITYVAGKLAGFIAGHLGGDSVMAITLTRTVIAIVGFIALGGAAWLRFDAKSVRKAWSFAKPLVIINIVLGGLISIGVLICLLDGDIEPGTALKSFLYVTVLCIIVGINEEAMFRGLLLGGLLAKMGGTKGGVLRAAIISSAVFGLMHVILDLDFTNGYSIASGLMKTLECSMFAFILCVPVLKERTLVGAMTVHAFFDWIIMVGNAITAGDVSIPTYTFTDPTNARAAMTIFAVMSVLYLPRTIRAFKELKNMETLQYGPFMTE